MIVVIGGGPAGRYAAMRLAGAGRQVILAERRREGLGGQCLHQGCMIICALNDVARNLDHLENLSRFGIITGIPVVQYGVLITRMREIINTIVRVIADETQAAGVTTIYGEATVSGKQVVINGETYSPEAIILATGTRPRTIDIPGSELAGVYSVKNIFSSLNLPDRLVIIGGGPVAVEMAYIFSVFGTSVTILVRSTLLKGFPDMLITEAKRELSRVSVREHTRVTRIIGDNSVTGVEIQEADGTSIVPVDTVLVATGAVAQTTGITGVPLDDEGNIRVNDRMETGIAGIYAAGDVTGSSWLTPLARWQGRCAADAILGVELPKSLIAVPQAIKLRNDLAFCVSQETGGISVTIPAPAGPGTFWEVPNRATGKASMTADPHTHAIQAMSEASPYASVVAAYHALLMNTGLPIGVMERFIEVHPSADGTGWIGRYLTEQIRARDTGNTP